MAIADFRRSIEAAASDFSASLYRPMLAPLTAHRSWVFGLAAIGSLQVGLALASLPGWVCPIHAATGLPCPGCHMTESIRLLLHGQVLDAFRAHAFAPVFLAVFLLVFGIAVQPGTRRERALYDLDNFERRTGLFGWMLVSLMIYWFIRLAGLV